MSKDVTNREPMLEVYLFEATQLLEQLEEISIRCEKNKDIDTDAINEIFRIMHTIKSSSAMMMFNNISILAHSLEDLFFFIRENKGVAIDFENLFDLVLLGIDFIKEEVIKIENGEEADGNSEELVKKSASHLEIMKQVNGADIKSEAPKNEETKYYISSYQNPSLKPKIKYVARIFFEDGCEMENVRAYTVVHNLKSIATELIHIPEDIIENVNSTDYIREKGFLVCFSTDLEKESVEKELDQIIFLRALELNEVLEYPQEILDTLKPKENENEIENGQEKEKGPTVKNSKHQNILSVNISKLDTLLDLVGEIVISEAMVTKNPDLHGMQLHNFNKAARQLRKLTNELQDIVMSIRMVPVAMTFQKMNRIVRDMSKKLNKEVDLEIIGEDTEVDKNIIDHISDPLMHLVRNALDHGLENNSGRLKAGKEPVGKITLEAKNAGGDVFIVVTDDGKGLDKDKIYNKAKSQGLTAKTINELSDKEIFSFILLPGFSTNENVTEFSGRGVGMDVVKKNIDSIGGSIAIDSIMGLGTTITIKIPLTLAIIDGLEVSVGKAKYTIPITSIRESFKVNEDQVIRDANGNEMMMIRGEAYSIFRIHNIYNINTNITDISKGIIVMVEGVAKTGCLFVDSLIGEQQVVVKALPKYIKKAEGLAGCTILGDGNISLILDVDGVLNR